MVNLSLGRGIWKIDPMSQASRSPEDPNPYAPPAELPADPPAGKPPVPTALLVPLFVLFGSLYFVQGIVEPTAGLLSQPLQSRLEDWGQSPTQVGLILAFIGIPWSLKPFFGPISDFLPIHGLRRRPYLILSTAAAAIAFLTVSGVWVGPEQTRLAAWLLLVVCAAVAMTDVVIDALAIEHGQPLGVTGQMQSVQWGAMSAATILAGTLGGFVAQHGYLRQAMVGCGILAAASLLTVLAFAREQRRPREPLENLRQAWRQILVADPTAGRIRGQPLAILVTVGMFLFLWNFNPFSSNVLQHYSTEVLGLSEQFYGNLYSVQGIAQFFTCIVYFFLCRRVPFRWLVHASIAAGVLATLCYWPMHNATTAILASLVFGVCYQIGTLIQLDLAARVVPVKSAATMFALLMAISNTGISAGIAVGGTWYDMLTTATGSRHAAFDWLVLIGAAFTAGCWLILPVMNWTMGKRAQA
jgi:predicted MFS family arabinose efflux permease